MDENWFKQKESVSWLQVAQISSRMGKGSLPLSALISAASVKASHHPPPFCLKPPCLSLYCSIKGCLPGSTPGKDRPLSFLEKRFLAFHWLWFGSGPSMGNGRGLAKTDENLFLVLGSELLPRGIGRMGAWWSRQKWQLSQVISGSGLQFQKGSSLH